MWVVLLVDYKFHKSSVSFKEQQKLKQLTEFFDTDGKLQPIRSEIQDKDSKLLNKTKK